MFFNLRRIIFALLCFVAMASTSGCSDTPPAVSVFETFSGHVQDGDYASAWSMLSSDSQKKLGNEAKLKELCEGSLAEVFKPKEGTHVEVKSPSFRDDKKLCEGAITLFDKDGKVLGKRGTWTVRDEDGTWKVFWTLSTSAGGAIPDGVKG